MIIQAVFDEMRPMPVFKPEMRKANRDGVKSQTRRVIDLRELRQVTTEGVLNDSFFYRNKKGTWQNISRNDLLKKCPYGKVGDYCYMREPMLRIGAYAWYKDDGQPVISSVTGERLKWRWKKDVLTSIFMPKEAARSIYQYTSIRVERVQDISEEDAIAEGLASWKRTPDDEKTYYGIDRPDVWETDPRLTYKRLFNLINEKRGFGWDVNPWVWVLEYAPAAFGTSPILRERQNWGERLLEVRDAT